MAKKINSLFISADILNVLGSLKYQTQTSYVSYHYFNLYKINLFEYIEKTIKDKNQIYDFINTLILIKNPKTITHTEELSGSIQGSTQSTGITNPVQPEEQVLSREERTGEDPNEVKSEKLLATSYISNIFKPTLYPEAISFGIQSVKEIQKEFSDGLGFIPFIWYNGHQIDADRVDYFILYNDGVVPSFKIAF